MELGVLCDCEVAVIVMTRDGHLASFSSQGMENILRRYALAAQSPHEVHTEEELYNRYVREPRQRMVSKETAKRKREGEDEEVKEASIHKLQSQQQQLQQQRKEQANGNTSVPANATAAVVTSPLRKRAKPTINCSPQVKQMRQKAKEEAEQQAKEMGDAEPKSEEVDPSAPVSTPSKRRANQIVNVPPFANNVRRVASVKVENVEEVAATVPALAVLIAGKSITKDGTKKQDANHKDTTTTATTVSAQTQQVEIPAPMETAFKRLGREFDKLTNQLQINGALSEAMTIRKANHTATASLADDDDDDDNDDDDDDGGDHTAVVEAGVSTDDDGGDDKNKKEGGDRKKDRSSTPPGKGTVAIDKSSAAVPSAMNGGLGAK